MLVNTQWKLLDSYVNSKYTWINMLPTKQAMNSDCRHSVYTRLLQGNQCAWLYIIANTFSLLFINLINRLVMKHNSLKMTRWIIVRDWPRQSLTDRFVIEMLQNKVAMKRWRRDIVSELMWDRHCIHENTCTHCHTHTQVGAYCLAGWPPSKTTRSSDSTYIIVNKWLPITLI